MISLAVLYGILLLGLYTMMGLAVVLGFMCGRS